VVEMENNKRKLMFILSDEQYEQEEFVSEAESYKR
jgi:hypothetical protein